MPSPRWSAIAVVAIAVLYQLWPKDILQVRYGFRRTVEPIENFQYKCRHLQDKQLEGCGDLWLDNKNRVLYAACTSLKQREQWDPSRSRLNVAGRNKEGSSLMAIYIDESQKNGYFKMHRIDPMGSGDDPGDSHLDLAGFDAQPLEHDDRIVRFWLLNQRPPYSPEGKLLSATKYGANTTIDVYEHHTSAKTMKFIISGKNPLFVSPNKIAVMSHNNFVVSNDRSAKVGFLKSFDSWRNSGNLLYHDDWAARYITTPNVASVPGMLAKGKDDRIYIPSLVDDKIRVYALGEGHVHTIRMGMPIASLTVDEKGLLWAVGRSKYDRTGRSSTNAIFTIKKIEVGEKLRFEVTKVLEDKKKRALAAVSVVRHDSKKQRMFLAGTYASGLTVCEHNAK